MTQVKFYRVEALPEVGEVGSLYFVYGSGGVQSLLYICVGTGLFELYTPDLYELENKIDALEDKVEEESSAIQEKIDNIDFTPIENKVDEGVSTLSTKIDNIDLSSVAKQGENTGATNTAILAEIKAINDLKNIYSVRFEQNQDGDNTYTMVLPLVAGIVGDTIII